MPNTGSWPDVTGTGTFTVRTGAAQKLYSALPSGVVIRNTDTTNAVWVSEVPSVAPGLGWKIAPLGSLTWNADGHSIYACVDTGVASDVTLMAGSAVEDVNDPVAVATATAAKLLATGIPLVYTNTQLQATLIGAGGSVLIDVHAYASLSVEADANGSGNPVAISLQWGQSSTPGDLTGHSIATALTSIDATIFPHWIMPVIGGWVRITNNSAGTIALSVFGSNRPVPRLTIVGQNTVPRYLSFSGTTVANGTYQLTAADGGDDSTVFNGPIILAWNVNTNPQCVGLMQMTAINASAQNVVTGGAIAGNTTQSFNHPSIPVKWAIFANVGVAGLIVNLAVVPAQSG